jgi:hypothetical protein
MPYKSQAQERFFNANRKKLEAQGVNVDEWNQASKGKKLPKKAKQTKAHGLTATKRGNQHFESETYSYHH